MSDMGVRAKMTVLAQTTAETAARSEAARSGKIILKIENKTNTNLIYKSGGCNRGTFGSVQSVILSKDTATMDVTAFQKNNFGAALVYYNEKDPRDEVCFRVHKAVGRGNCVGFEYFWDVNAESSKNPEWYYKKVPTESANDVHYRSVNKTNLECWYITTPTCGCAEAAAAWVITSCIW